MRSCIHILATIVLLAALAPYDVGAQSLVPFPTIPKANDKPDFHGDVEIRKEHMLFLMHQRVETVREGLRPEENSLKACLTCHAVKDDTGTAVSYKSPEHFCRVCHDYAAVQVDCFECHSSLPSAPTDMTAAAEGLNQ